MEEYSLTDKPLSLATTAEIWEELTRRSHAVVLGIANVVSEDDGEPSIWTLTHGSRIYLRGMVEELRDELVVMSREISEQSHQEDE